MPRRFTDARALLHDLLDRYEAGTPTPRAHLDDEAFADVSELDRFVKQLVVAEEAGAIRIARGRGRDSDHIQYVKLEAAVRLYELLGRRPVGELAAEASRRLLEELDLPAAFDAPIAA